MPAISILGIRGVPGAHGGFETFAERLAPYLAGKGWQVTVYCQEIGDDPVFETEWEGVRRVHIPVRGDSVFSTVVFDWRSVGHAVRRPGAVLTLGYNTALFSARYRLYGVPNLTNMDGIEWARDKWGVGARAWLWLNEAFGCWFSHHLIADHPEIKKHLLRRTSDRKVTMIPYGADNVRSANEEELANLKLEPGGYVLVIGRPEPENSILEIVRAFSGKSRGLKLVVLGHYDPLAKPFHRAVMEAASDEVLFPGAIYDRPLVSALRFHCRLYIHGHKVGGTNPSLVEALGAGSPVLAHDNRFNRWVAGPGASYFAGQAECAGRLDQVLDDAGRLTEMAHASRVRFKERFTWGRILSDYEELLLRWCNQKGSVPGQRTAGAPTAGH